jgi:ABC-type dipeptide/oligopeptide/nickel transport system permease component
MGLTMFAALLVVLGNLLSDILYATLDPRVRY